MSAANAPKNEEVTSSIIREDNVPTITQKTPKRGSAFWLVFVAGLVVDLLSALDLTAVSTALPTIVDHLNGTDFIWVGSAYAIASTAILPIVGGLASTLGRKSILLAFIACFAAGSAICGSARSMNALIAGRTIQGVGGGGCISVTEIIYADLVPLPERGKFLGVTASVWALACAIGPPIGGILAQSGAWRWLFYLNIPLCGVGFSLVFVFLNVNYERKSLKHILRMINWWGLLLVISSTIAINIALVWGGVRHPWASVEVLVPLCLGGIGLLLFLFLDMKYAKLPIIPPFILNNRTTLSGYIGTALHGIVSMATIFYFPVYFQACKGASPIRSGIDFLGVALVVPLAAIITGASVQVFDCYRPQNYIGWTLTSIGFGVLTILDANSSKDIYVGLQILLGAGLGIVWIGTQFPILAPLPFSNNASALAFFTFIRCFCQSWGVAMGGAILQNTLSHGLPSAFVNSFAPNSGLVYAAIPQIKDVPIELQNEVRKVFADGIRFIWYTMLGISVLGLISCFMMKEEVMKQALDERWGLKEDNNISANAVGLHARDKSLP